MQRYTQRLAIATHLGCDVSEIEEYQPSRPVHPRIKLFVVGDDYLLAVKGFGRTFPIPEAILAEYPTWDERADPWLNPLGWRVFQHTVTA